MKHYFILDKSKHYVFIVYDFYTDFETAKDFLKSFELKMNKGLYLVEVFNV